MAIQVKSPTRVDLAGGTLDIMPLTHILRSCTTVNFAVSLHAQVQISASQKSYRLQSQDQGLKLEGSFETVTQAGQLPWLEKLLAYFWSKDLMPLCIEVEAKSPAGAGLGGSSCLGIAMASALLKARVDIGEPWSLGEVGLVQTVQDLETSLIRVPTGCQDYWGGLRGGINVLSFPPGGPKVETLCQGQGQALQELLILCYTGVSRASGNNNWAIFRRAFDGDRATLERLNEIGELAAAVALAIKEARWGDVFKYSAEEWQVRASLWSDIETLETRRIALAAKNCGALFSRICGAGGGGVMAIFAEPSQHKKVRQGILEAGGQILNGELSWQGTQVSGCLV